MDAQTQLPTFTLAVYVGVLAIIVVLAVAFTMLRIYAYRNRLSTVTISASYDADAELADANSNALIATTLSALGSPLPDFPDEPPVTSKTSMLSSFGSSRWEQVRSFVAGIRSRGPRRGLHFANGSLVEERARHRTGRLTIVARSLMLTSSRRVIITSSSR